MKFNQADVVAEKKSCGIHSGIKFTETRSMKSSSFWNDSETFYSQSIV